MAYFLWSGIDNMRQHQQGVQAAANKVEVIHIMALQGVFLSKVWRIWPWQRRYIPMSLFMSAALFKQWGRMLQAGLNITDCIALAMPAKPTMQLRWQLCQLEQRLQQGEQLSQALQQVKLVPTYQATLLSAAEQAGQLCLVLQQMAKQQASFAQLIKNCRKSLLMPAITLSVGILISILLLIGLVPNISGLVATGEAEIPVATQWLIALSEALQNHGATMVQWLILIVVMTGLVLQLPVSSKYIIPMLKNRVLYRLPIIHSMVLKQQIVHLLQLLWVSQSSGVPLIQLLSIFNSASDSDAMQKKTGLLRESLLAGNTLSDAFSAAEFEESLVRMLMMGERTGDLNNAFKQMAEDADNQLQESMLNIRNLLEPLITLFLALLVGGLVVAIYLPLMQLGSLI